MLVLLNKSVKTGDWVYIGGTSKVGKVTAVEGDAIGVKFSEKGETEYVEAEKVHLNSGKDAYSAGSEEDKPVGKSPALPKSGDKFYSHFHHTGITVVSVNDNQVKVVYDDNGELSTLNAAKWKQDVSAGKYTSLGKNINDPDSKIANTTPANPSGLASLHGFKIGDKVKANNGIEGLVIGFQEYNDGGGDEIIVKNPAGKFRFNPESITVVGGTTKSGKPKKVVKHPGSKGGKGYYDNKGVWHYGPKPKPKQPKQDDVAVSGKGPIPGVVYKNTANGTFWLFHEVKNGQAVMSVVSDKDGSNPKAPDKFGLSYILDALDKGTLVQATNAKEGVPGQANKVYPVSDYYKEAHASVVYYNLDTQHLFHCTKVGDDVDLQPVDDKFAKKKTEGYAPVVHIPRATFEDRLKKGRILPVYDIYKKKEFAAGVKASGVLPGEEMEQVDRSQLPAQGDVFYDKNRDVYWHIAEVGDTASTAVKVYDSQKFEDDKYENTYAKWKSLADWKKLTSGSDALSKVDGPQPVKNDIANVHEGDVYYNSSSGLYFLLIGIDRVAGEIEYMYFTKGDEIKLSKAGSTSTMNFFSWRDSRSALEYRNSIDLPPIKALDYKPGDTIVSKEVLQYYGAKPNQTAKKVFYADKNNVYLVTEMKEGSERFEIESRKGLDKRVAFGQARYKKGTLKATKPIVPPAVAPPPLDSENLPVKMPKVGDIYQGTWNDPRVEGRKFKVSDIAGDSIEFSPVYSYGSDLFSPFRIPKDKWDEEGPKVFEDVNYEKGPGYHPPEPVGFETYTEEGQGIHAKMKVCKALYYRLAADPEFFAASQEAFPGKLDVTDRRDSGLDVEQLEDEPEASRQQAKVYLHIRRLVHLWAITSADTQAKAQAVQRAVRDEFGLNEAYDAMSSFEADRVNPADPKAGEQAFRTLLELDYRRYGSVYRKFVRAQYDTTQKLLAEKGVSELTLYRGVRNASQYVTFRPSDEGKKLQKVILQPQSSFTTHPEKAKEFAESETGIVYAHTFPANRILSTALSGVGCLDEHEVTILGGPPEEMMAFDVSSYYSEEMGSTNEELWKSLPGSVRRISPTVHPIDADVRDADWPKRTLDIPHNRVKRILRGLGIPEHHFRKLPSGQAYIRRPGNPKVTKSALVLL